MNRRPLHGRAIVHRLDEDQHIGGIIIPDGAKEKPQQGTIVAAGNGKALANGKRVRLDAKAGDRILFGTYSGQEFKMDGNEYVIMREDDVLAVIQGRPQQTASVPGRTSTMLTKKRSKRGHSRAS